MDRTKRKFSRQVKIDAVRLVTDRGVAVAQGARDLDVAESVLWRWMRELTTAPAAAFPGNGQMRSDLAKIEALKNEVARLRAAPSAVSFWGPRHLRLRTPIDRDEHWQRHKNAT